MPDEGRPRRDAAPQHETYPEPVCNRSYTRFPNWGRVRRDRPQHTYICTKQYRLKVVIVRVNSMFTSRGLNRDWTGALATSRKLGNCCAAEPHTNFLVSKRVRNQQAGLCKNTSRTHATKTGGGGTLPNDQQHPLIPAISTKHQQPHQSVKSVALLVNGKGRDYWPVYVYVGFIERILFFFVGSLPAERHNKLLKLVHAKWLPVCWLRVKFDSMWDWDVGFSSCLFEFCWFLQTNALYRSHLWLWFVQPVCNALSPRSRIRLLLTSKSKNHRCCRRLWFLLSFSNALLFHFLRILAFASFSGSMNHRVD